MNKALEEFPEDVAAAAKLASDSVSRMKAPTDPACRTLAADARRNRTMSDLHWMTLVEAAGAVAARKLSPVELMSALLKRVGQAIDTHAGPGRG